MIGTTTEPFRDSYNNNNVARTRQLRTNNSNTNDPLCWVSASPERGRGAAAKPAWRNMLPHERARLLNRVADLMMLAAYFHSRDIGRVWRASEALECGIVGINVGIIANEMAPSAALNSPASGARGPNTESKSISKPSTCVWGKSTSKEVTEPNELGGGTP